MRRLLLLSLFLTGCATPTQTLTSTPLSDPRAAEPVAPKAGARPRTTHAPASRSRTTVPERDALDWHGLAMCESSDNPTAVSPSGAYRGLYQFDLRTWRSVGGSGDPARANRTEQTLRARLLYAARGRAPWPVCGGLL